MIIRDFNLMKHLSERHRFTVICFADGTPREIDNRIESLSAYCDDVFTVRRESGPDGRWQARIATAERLAHPVPWNVRSLTPRALHQQVKAVVKQKGPFDIIHINHVEMAPLFAYADRAKRVIGLEVVTPKLKRLLEVQHKWVYRMIDLVELKKFARYECSVYDKADLCTMVSDVEMQNVHALVPQARVSVIPNGVDTSYMTPSIDSGNNSTTDSFVFLGTLSYQPNHDAVLFFHRDIWPLIRDRLPSLRWRIVGRDPSPEVRVLASSKIEVTGWVDDVRPYLWASRALVVPLRSGSGTRLKILEAMAAGIPVVSTSIGAEGLAVTHGEDILLADTPDQFADALIRLLQDPDLATELARRARQLVEKQYNWSVITDRLDQGYRGLFN